MPSPWASRVTAIVALGLGCGITSADHLAGLTSSDVRRDQHDAVYVDVPGRKHRRVYARSDWSDEIWRVKQRRSDQPFLCEAGRPTHNAFNRLTSAAASRGGPNVTSARLRATWLVWHLERGTRLDVLCAAAGLSTPLSIGSLMRFVSPATPQHAARLMRAEP